MGTKFDDYSCADDCERLAEIEQKLKDSLEDADYLHVQGPNLETALKLALEEVEKN